MKTLRHLQKLLEAAKLALNPDLKERIQQNFKSFTIPKGRVLVDLGQVSPCLYLIEKGVMRSYISEDQKI